MSNLAPQRNLFLGFRNHMFTLTIFFMKKINYRLLSFFVVLLCVFSNQVVFADIIIRKDNTDPATQPNNVVSAAKSLSMGSKANLSSAKSFIAVTADLSGSDLIVDFSSTVGTAVVSVVDQDGNVVYQTVVDTYSTPEVVIPVDGLSSGNYSLKISYGSTHLTGDFQL